MDQLRYAGLRRASGSSPVGDPSFDVQELGLGEGTHTQERIDGHALALDRGIADELQEEVAILGIAGLDKLPPLGICFGCVFEKEGVDSLTDEDQVSFCTLF